MNGIILDTNILVYAINDKYENYNQAKDFLENLINSETQIYLPDKVLHELFRVLTSKPFKEILSSQEAYLTWKFFAFNPRFSILFSDKKTLSILDRLIQKYPNYHIFDLVVLAFALNGKVDTVYTYNLKDFPNLDEIEVSKPF